MKRIGTSLRHLMDLTPRETWRLARGRLPFVPKGPAWTAMDLLASVKHRHGIRFAELLLRQEAILSRELGWKPLDFAGARVVEVGCGPLAGFGPLAVFCGADVFESAEPEWDSRLFFSQEISDRYLRVMHADLTGLYGPRISFDTFQELLSERIKVHKSGFAAAPVSGEADIVLSQSCLEHVFPLETTIEKIETIQTPLTRFIHLVDFGNHYLTPSPFDGLYDQPPESYIAARGEAINMLRVSDISALFECKDIPAQVVPSRVIPHSNRRSVHSWWRERYDDDALFTQLALVVSIP